MLETDSPYLSPEPNRKTINEPSKIGQIFEFTSSLFDDDKNNLKDSIYHNSIKFFNLEIS